MLADRNQRGPHDRILVSDRETIFVPQMVGRTLFDTGARARWDGLTASAKAMAVRRSFTRRRKTVPYRISSLSCRSARISCNISRISA